jgi:large conductance mechanosensitive channel
MSADSPSTWGSSDAHETLVHTNATLNRKIRSAWTGFLNFALRDNVLEVAVGLMYVLWSLSSLFFRKLFTLICRIAAAFTSVVKSLVSDILLPPVSLLPFMSRNLEEKFLVMRKGSHYSKIAGYNTRQQAMDDGAVILTYGWVIYVSVA